VNTGTRYAGVAVTAAEFNDLLDECVAEALATLRRHMADPDPANSRAACREVIRLKCALVRHGGSPVGGGSDPGEGLASGRREPVEDSRTRPTDVGRLLRSPDPDPDDDPAAALATGVSALRDLLGLPDRLDQADYARHGLDPTGRPTPATLRALGLPEDLDFGPVVGDPAGDFRAVIAGRLAEGELDEQELAAGLAELGLTSDGRPDPAAWGEEALTDPDGLLRQIVAGRRPPQSGPLAPRAGAEDPSL